MKLETKHFGTIEVDEGKIINFNEGLPGFPELRRFLLMTEPKQGEGQSSDGVFFWLQSVDEPNVAFVLLNMLKIMPEYNPLVERTDMENLGEYDEQTFNFYNIAVLPDDIKNMTVNLKAPVVINTEKRTGKQVVCTNDEYTVRHYMFK